MKVKKPGFIYCFSHPLITVSLGDNVYKLGRTNSTECRIKSAKTFMLTEMDCLHKVKVKNDVDAEKLLFEHLSEYRIRKDREFFLSNLCYIKRVMNNVADIINSREYAERKIKGNNDIISPKLLNELCKPIVKLIVDMVEEVYVHTPENRNIFVPSRSRKEVCILQNSIWTIIDSEEPINNIFIEICDIITKLAEKYKGKLPRQFYNELKTKINNIGNKEESRIKKDIHLLLYNNKNIIKSKP